MHNALKDLKLANYKKREAYVEKLLDYYNGITKGYVQDYFDSDAFREVPVYEANITKRLVNKMSRIYTIGANRNVNSRYDGLTRVKDARMKHIERMTRLIGTVANRVIWTPSGFEYVPVYFFAPYFEGDPLNPSAITYPLMNPVDDISNDAEQKYIYWDKDVWAIKDEDGVIEDSFEHGYGVLPFVFTHRENQIDSFFVSGANDIINANEHTNITMTELQLGLRFQMFGQQWTTGEMPNNQRMGSNFIMELGEDNSFGIESPAGDLTSVIESIKFQIELVAQNNHLWIQWSEQGGEVPSGVSMMIKDLERTEDYEDDLGLWRMYEEKIYEVERAVAKANGVNLPEKFGVDFNEPEYPKTVQDQILWDKHRLEMNLTNEAELLVEYNNDLSIEEAEAKIATNKDKNKKLSIFDKVRTGSQEQI